MNTFCKNCNTKLEGDFCYCCGQKDTEITSLRNILKDFFSTFFSLDSTVFKTMLFLITKPGFLTKKYWEGKRGSYLSPFRVYFVISIFYFLLIPFQPNQTYILCSASEIESHDTEALVKQKKASLIEKGVETPDELHYISLWFEVEKEKDLGYVFWKGTEIADKRDMTIEGILSSFVPATMFMLMPLMAAILLLIFYKNKQFLYIHHLITSVHLHSFIFFMLILAELFSHILFTFPMKSEVYSFFIGVFLLMIPLVYSFIMFKNIYEFSWFKSIFKSLLLFVIYIIGLSITFPLILIGYGFVLGYF